jgi:hypothetical protein
MAKSFSNARAAFLPFAAIDFDARYKTQVTAIFLFMTARSLEPTCNNPSSSPVVSVCES